MFFPLGGWVSPVDLCLRLIQHPNIRFQQAEVSKLKQTCTGWQVDTNIRSFVATVVDLATVDDTKSLLPQSYLLIKLFRGQLSFLIADTTIKLITVFSSNSFITTA